jgi:hypothetical protein
MPITTITRVKGKVIYNRSDGSSIVVLRAPSATVENDSDTTANTYLPGDCARCHHFSYNAYGNCRNCGKHRDRPVRRNRRHRKATGKRGRNSGNVSNHGKKN